MIFKREVLLLVFVTIYYVAAVPVVEGEELVRQKRTAGHDVQHLSEEVATLKEDLTALRSKFRKTHKVVHVRGGRHDDHHDDDHHDDNHGDVHVHVHTDDECCHGDRHDDHHDEDEHLYAHCEMVDFNPEAGGDEHVHGHVNFEQRSRNGPVAIEVHLKGFEHHQGDHSFEIHVNGDISDKCHNLGAEFDDSSEDHSRYHSKTGDFGDLHSDDHGHAFHNFTSSRIHLGGRHSIVGMGLAVHHSAHGSADHDRDIIGCCVIGRATSAHHRDHHHDTHDDVKPKHAHCEMIDIDPEHGLEHVHGTILFEQESDSSPLHVAVNLEGFEHHEGDHAFEIHQYGDVSGQCHHIGRPYDDVTADHSHNHGATGDFGDIHSDAQGHAVHNFTNARTSLFGSHSVIGKSLAVHHSAHGSADSTDVVGCCVIGGDSDPHDDQHAAADEHYYAGCTFRDIDPEHGLEHVEGHINMQQTGTGAVHMEAELEGFEHHAGDHAFEVHVDGDIGNHCHNIGEPYDDPTVDHSTHHEATGDFGDLHSDDEGHVRQNITNNRVSLHGAHNIIGKSIAIHHSAHGSSSDTDVIGCCVIGSAKSFHHEPEVHVYGVCHMHEVDPEHGVDHVVGTIDFEQNAEGGPVHLGIHLSGFEHHEGDHAFEVHSHGDATHACENIGPKYDDASEDHSHQQGETGDFGDLHTDANGVSNQTMTNTRVSLVGDDSILGRSLAVHHSAHGTADATDVIGCCVIGRSSGPEH